MKRQPQSSSKVVHVGYTVRLLKCKEFTGAHVPFLLICAMCLLYFKEMTLLLYATKAKRPPLPRQNDQTSSYTT